MRRSTPRAPSSIPRQFDQKICRLHELLLDDAVTLVVVHDTNPRAMSSRVKGFVTPQNWFADFTSVSIG